MAEIRFKTEWLTAIALLASCGTPDDVADLCAAIQRASLDLPINEMSSLTETLFHPIAEEIRQEQAISEARASAGACGGKRKANRSKDVAKTKQNCSKTVANLSKIVANESKEKEEAREEDREESGEESKEEIPHTPLEENKEEGKEEIEEEKEEERETNARARVRESETAVTVFDAPLPEPTFAAETDPGRLTDKVLEDEFEALWVLYPNRKGKQDALRHYKAARKSGVAYDTIEQGIMRYCNHIRDEHTDPKYIAMGSTWFCGHRWEDVYVRHGPKPGSMEWLAEIASGGGNVT